MDGQTLFVVTDIEADGPTPLHNSMLSFASVAIEADGTGSVSWSLVRAGVLTALNGTYALTGKAKGPTKVTYDLEVDLKIPMIGMLKRKAEKVIVDTALKGLKQRVESHPAD